MSERSLIFGHGHTAPRRHAHRRHGGARPPRRRARRRRPHRRRRRAGHARRRRRTPRSSTSTASSLAPGFIDVHTHYDAQILWDGDLTPSSWHGVTSVVMGNCGFGVAPTRPEHRDTIARTLENVEGMSLDAARGRHRLVLRDVPRVPARPSTSGPSASTSAPSSATRRCACSWSARDERPATADEVERDAGRRSARRSRPAPSGSRRRASPPTRAPTAGRCPAGSPRSTRSYALASVLGELGKGVIQVSIGPGPVRRPVLRAGRAPTASPSRGPRSSPGPTSPAPRCAPSSGARALPGEVYPQIACRPIVMQIRMTDPVPLAEIDVWKEVLARPREERAALLRATRRGATGPGTSTLDAWSHRWAKTSVEETGVHPDAVGVPLDELAAARGTTPFDLLLDLAARRRHGHPLPHRARERRRRRDRRPARRQAHAARPVRRRRPRQPALRRLLLDPPARPLGARAQGAVARGRRLAAHRPPARGVPDPRARPGAGGLLRRPRRVRPRHRRHARRSSGCTTSPAAPTASSSQHRRRARVGQRRADPHATARTSPARRPGGSSAPDVAGVGRFPL